MDLRKDLRKTRKQMRAAATTARWFADNPAVVRDLAVGAVRAKLGRDEPDTGTSAAAAAGDRVVPAGLADFDRQVSASADSPATPAQIRALAGDLSLLPQWMTIHGGFRGTAPTGAAAGVTYTQQLKIMGVPAEIAWEVTQADDTTVGLFGTGPMGLSLGLWLSVEATPEGTRAWIDAGMGGEPLRGPMGATISKTVGAEMADSLAQLVALHEAGVEGKGGTGAAPVTHRRTGRVLDPSTPVIVGVGQVVQRTPDPTKDPATLAAQALRRAADDAGAPGLLQAADAVYAVSSASYTYGDQARATADALGISPERTVQSVPFGGDSGQVLVNAAAEAVAAGDASVVLVCGAEAGASFAHAQKQGVEVDWPEQPAGTKPDQVLGNDRDANNEAEAQAGLMAPIYVYALLENAMRAKLGNSREEHQARITGLWSRYSEIAAANPYAWQPEAYTPEQLATADADNRMISAPYSKLLCANMTVDLASGIIVTSVAAAEAAGIDQDLWVFPQVGASGHDEWFVSERGDLASSPAIRALGTAALQHAGLSIDDLRHVDLYSCFPVAVQIAASELGLPLDDPERPLSLTGGLTFGGGPGNNYGGHNIAAMVAALRQDPGGYGLTTSLGWYVTKHALGLYSTEPPAAPFEFLHPVLDPEPSRPALLGYSGPAVVESYTVIYDRDNTPATAIVSAITPDGARVLVRSEEPAVATELATADPLGWQVEVSGSKQLTVTGREPVEVPAVPEPTVLVEKRGAVRVITLNRPHRRNAIDHPTAELLERVVDAFEADPTAKVAILTGAGGTFSAGMDLKAAAGGQFPLTERRGPLGITGAPIRKPVIAAVEGHALAGGCELALVADLIVASTESQFGLPEPKRGLVAAAGGVLRLAQRLPRNVAMEMVLSGDPQPATRMAELGLVNRLAEPGKVLDAALELAEQILRNAPISLEVGKQIITESPDWSREEEFARQSDLAGRALFSDDATEGVAAFAENRDPVWTGR
ncbi:crotonase/enoyl-CoA hydratase family protein [Nocardioides sp. zg-ZUI104]|uniref:type II toxin-antitoxin system Rv0910 family toxin n=1 Tax=Nocardioides faecalis TaxID=2803858 RepID=UPI001BCBD49A|nr:crotonase/enoyl-CoA hydratase family protein [Nocardioides faecalis]MBS4752869.1 crotonase/enoyl-CoA hydratase family protein [Nocardioides faecalis]